MAVRPRDRVDQHAGDARTEAGVWPPVVVVSPFGRSICGSQAALATTSSRFERPII
jgi:hypothetical protein